MIIFCSDPINPKNPDSAFERDIQAAKKLGIPYVLIDHESLDHYHDINVALKRVPAQERKAFYRGWMLELSDYDLLYNGLYAKGIELITDTHSYQIVHYGPYAYDTIKEWTAKTVLSGGIIAADIGFYLTDKNPAHSSWQNSIDKIWRDALKTFGNGPIIIKDWVKSQSDYWDEACFIPDASDFDNVKRIVTRFVELQGDSLVGGIVFREYLPFKKVNGKVAEWRSWVVGGKSVGCWPRFGADTNDMPPSDFIDKVASAMQSPFVTVDFACHENGNWYVVEVGDGQVSGIQDKADPELIFSAVTKYIDENM